MTIKAQTGPGADRDQREETLMSESVCTCGAGLVCDRKCAGALAQQRECAERGHLTAQPLRAANGDLVSRGDFCFRCGETQEA